MRQNSGATGKADDGMDLYDWVQFECTDCLQLEFSYQAFRISGKNAY